MAVFFVLSDDCVDTDEIRVAGGAVDSAAGEDDVVARLQVQRLLCRLSRVVEQHVGRFKMLAQNRLHAPRERQLVPDRLACRHADNIGRHAEARDHAHRSAGQRAYHNRFCTDVDCHAAGGVGDGVEQVADLEFCVAEAGFVVDVLLGIVTLARPGGAMSFLCIVFGIPVLADGLFKIQISLDAKRFGIEKWWVVLLLAALTCVIGLLLVIRPSEAARALVAALQKHTQPVSKITIVPHTSGALGYTMQTPEEEKYLSSREELIVELQTLLGGRAAEQIVFGIATTGASNDIERATELARKMVTQYGMSEKFGLMALSTVSNQYLDGSTMMNCADETAYAADSEIQKLLESCYEQAKAILREHRELLDEVALYLLQKETITGDELMTYVNAEGKRLQAPEQPEDRAADEPAPDAPDSEDSAADAPTQDV